MVAPKMTFGPPGPWWNPYQPQQGTQPGQAPLVYNAQQPQMQQPQQPGGFAAPQQAWFMPGGTTGAAPMAQRPVGAAAPAPYMALAGGDQNYARAQEDPNVATSDIGGNIGSKVGSAPWFAAQTAGQPGTETKMGTGQPNATPTPMAEFNPAATGQGKVTVGQDGSWTLPNGTVIPASARTTINVNGQQVALPFYNGVGMPGRGDFRFTINGAQEDALTFLARRLGDAQRRGLNIQDPNVIYDEIARIRDDAMRAGVPEADLDRATGIGGLQNFVRGSADASGNAIPAPGATGGGPTVPGAGGTGTPDQGGAGGGGGGTGGRAAFREDQISAMMDDPDLALALYKQWATGSSRAGTGPFSRHFDRWFEPVVSAAINALATGGKRLTSADVEQLFGQLKGDVRGGGVANRVSGMAQRAMADAAGGGIGEDYDLLREAASRNTPLMALGLSPIWRSAFLRGQQNTFADMFDAAQADPNFGEGITDWGQRLANSDFYRRWYNLR